MNTQDNHTPDLPKARRDFHKKGGRPQKDEKDKKKAVSTYFTIKERDELEKKAGEVPLSIYIHKMALDGEVVQAIPDDIADAVKKVSGMSNNLNQITRQVNAACMDKTDRRVNKLVNLTPQLEYQSKMIGQLLIYIASLCSQR